MCPDRRSNLQPFSVHGTMLQPIDPHWPGPEELLNYLSENNMLRVSEPKGRTDMLYYLQLKKEMALVAKL